MAGDPHGVWSDPEAQADHEDLGPRKITCAFQGHVT